MTQIIGEVGPCCWSYLEGEIDDAAWREGLTRLQDFTARHRNGLVLTVAYKASPPTARQRKELSECMSDILAKNSLGAHAMVTESTLVRGTLTAIGWFVKKTYDERVFNDLTEATRWLKSFRRDLNLSALHDALRQRIPDHVAWRRELLATHNSNDIA